MISGTSYDGIDVAAVELALEKDVLTLRLLGSSVVEYDPVLHDAIGAVLPPHQITIADVAKLDTALGRAFAQAAALAVDQYCGGRADLVVSHGQTVYHWLEGGQALGSLQIGEPAWIAELCGLPVVSGLRTRDIAAGGQGAPLVGTVDALLLSGRSGTPAALNIGGIANITIVPTDGPVLAFDTGPGNALIDAAVLHYSDGESAYDADGAWAATGKVHTGLLNHLLADDYYQETGPKSTGKEYFHLPYLLSALEEFSEIPAEDVIATVTELTVATIAASCRAHRVTEIAISGGGADNPILMRSLTEAIGDVPIYRSDNLGIPAEAKEAVAFAVLGFLTFNGIEGTIPTCTGAKRSTLIGNITPGSSPLILPEPSASPLRMEVLEPGVTH